MFELNDAAIDAIIFAMEDQEGLRQISIETGAIVLSDASDAAVKSVAPPTWSSREGYHLMERFLRTIRNPGPRHELSAALNRGRGVFRAFKEVLVSYPEVDRAFQEFKLRSMREVIRSWYDDLREARGLARLGSEPEETDDLVESDFGIEVGSGLEHFRFFGDLLAKAEEEAQVLLPAVIVAREAEILRERMQDKAAWLCAFISDGEGGTIAAAAALREHVADRSLARIVFLYVLPDFRRAGIGRSLLAALQKSFAAEGNDIIVLDSIFLPVDFSERLEVSGLSTFGIRGYFQP